MYIYIYTYIYIYVSEKYLCTRKKRKQYPMRIQIYILLTHIIHKFCSSSPPHSAATIARGLAACMSEAWSASRLYVERAWIGYL